MRRRRRSTGPRGEARNTHETLAGRRRSLRMSHPEILSAVAQARGCISRGSTSAYTKTTELNRAKRLSRKLHGPGICP